MSITDRDPAALPMGLRERVMAASRQARVIGRPVPAVPRISASEAFGRTADAFYELLCALSDDDWKTPALRGLDVQGLVGHLTGVEEDTHRALAGDAAVAEAGHVESTQGPAVRQAGRSPALTRSDWRRAADRTLELVGAAEREPRAGASAADDCAGRLAMHGMRLPLGDLLVVRAFELWVHDNDIRRAVGRPPSVPGPPVLRLMSDLAARMLPYAAVRTGLPAADVHLVLTGPGGGTWDVAIGPGDGGPGDGGPGDGGPGDGGPGDGGPGDGGRAEGGPGPGQEGVAIVTDAVGFCLLAANRVTADDLDLHVTGDSGRAAGVLAAASTLALD